MSSPFLKVPETEWVAFNALGFAIRDRYPVSQGHTLVIPRRPVATWFEATVEEQRALFELVDEVKRGLDASHRPDGYNVGINVGEAAGQTVFHLHVHVIPRYLGDMADPRGGVRHVIPGKGNYLATSAKPLATGGLEDPFLRHLEPLFARAMEVAVLAAFVQDSGLEVLRESVEAALARGARVRILTGDYLAITQATALRRLLDWMDESQARRDEGETRSETRRGIFEARVVETEMLGCSFHPKSWRFEGPGMAAAFVGSSNVSHAALRTGVEWNLRVERDRDPQAWQQVVEAFESWWARALRFDAIWVERYAARARREARPPLSDDAEEEKPQPPRQPHEVQQEALAALARSRHEGRQRALVVLATGLGKTLLAALDVDAFEQAHKQRARVLFLAHRAELLAQVAETFRRQLPESRFGWFVAEQSVLEGDVVFASVQKLSRPENLEKLRETMPFDYVVVDEVHHAAAASYRAILTNLEPRFLLGLTATPERADEGDVLGLFDDHLAYRADVGEGIARGLLVPFAYYGLKDDVAYENIPWRNRRFDPEKLAAAVQTEARMRRMWSAWEEHRATRTLVFCCSVAHANYVKDWLKDRGVRVMAVHSARGTDDRAEALRKLASGELDAVCAVDLFNEGVDVPSVDRVVMLRPTESPVVFLQQLGRGLRKAKDKPTVTVIDFVGNHRVFLDRVRALLALADATERLSLRDFLVDGKEPELPPGCSVQVELEAKELLAKLLPNGHGEVERVYRELRAAWERRPTAGELYRMGYRPASLRGAYGGWLPFVRSEEDLTPEETLAQEAGTKWFEELETTPMSKSFKMVSLEAMLDAGALGEGLPLSQLAERSLAILRRSPELLKDIEGVKALGDDWRNPKPEAFLKYWEENPVQAWVGGPWFRKEGNRFVPRLPIPESAREAFLDLTRELVDYRLAQYRARQRMETLGSAFEAKIIRNSRDPIIKLPSRTKRTDLPEGETDVRLPDGSPWRFRMAKEYCNVARLAGTDRNALPDLLRRWFGPTVGMPGTAFHVRFTPGPDGWSVAPVEAEVIPLPPRGTLVAFPSLLAAAGAATHALALEIAPEAEQVSLPVQTGGEGLFAVRASGDSMDGGERPIRDGDWLVMRYARAAGIGAVEGKVALVQVPDPAGYGFQIKRVIREGGRWMLRSDNPARTSFEATEDTIPIALLVEVVPPEKLGPARGERMTDEEAARAFGLSSAPKTGRIQGHLFLCVTEKETLTEPDRLNLRIDDRRPAETAFVLTRIAPEAPWRYAGVARWLDDEDRWALAEPVDYATWRALGHGRQSSRRLPPGLTERAAAWVQHLLSAHPAGSTLEQDGKRCRIVGRATEGGVRVDGGEGGFEERTVSLKDIAWALLALDDARATGGTPDEARVNRLRYLEGTPKGSTRWIDTGWALYLLRALKEG
ncbi:DEAD/DEAH box helicase family protein [Vitiosangium sp. GDMCC 1.1324]|uniref:DEAD/DEAH box helicase family protein n=1 Tax=Vitiosangium sp. (strain GDMCC 1.1324) TaxID=2138576 RepID=UPI000D3939DD|nr:DEAD/DEAH box helicase family protein [Vitiosangium sp. GDMCC 1.1324]PTL81528.1 DEAD/DEAH box helicase [Vitiosangium sp. GDMCC 1.1324]